MTIKECEENIVKLKKRVAVWAEQANNFQERADMACREAAEMKAELAALEERLNQLKAEDMAEANVWPKYGDRYFVIFDSGRIDWVVWYGTSADNERLSIGNCFRTEEDAEFVVERLKVLADMRKSAFEPDWKDNRQQKWSIFYDCEDNTIQYPACRFYSKGMDMYFESRERAKECVATIGEERLKKYYFGVRP